MGIGHNLSAILPQWPFQRIGKIGQGFREAHGVLLQGNNNNNNNSLTMNFSTVGGHSSI